MNVKTLTLVIAAGAIILAPLAAGQANSTWKGEDNEYGSIRVPYTLDMDGQRVPLQAEVIIHDMYHDKDGRFYMFAFDAQNTPLDVTLEKVIREDTGQELKCFQESGDGKQAKCVVDGHDMPPAGTKLLMFGTVGSSRTGTFTVGAIALPFTATWFKIQMKNGFEAELYAGSQVNVHSATSGSNKLGGLGNKIPDAGVAGLLVAAVAATGLAVYRRR